MFDKTTDNNAEHTHDSDLAVFIKSRVNHKQFNSSSMRNISKKAKSQRQNYQKALNKRIVQPDELSLNTTVHINHELTNDTPSQENLPNNFLVKG